MSVFTLNKDLNKQEFSKHDELKTILYNDPDNYISNVEYKMKTCCTDKIIIERLKKDGKLNPGIDNEKYLIPCDNNEKYIIGDKIASGGFNIVYNLKDNNDKILDDKVMRISQFNPKYRNDQLNLKMENTINGLFLQNYISTLCPYICKVYEFGYLVDRFGKKKHVYAILEKLFIPDLFFLNAYLYGNNNGINFFNCKRIIFNIVEGLKCMQDNGFVHLDIKLENIGIGFNVERKPETKIIDFDFARFIKNDEIDINDNVRVNNQPKYLDPYIALKKKIHKNSDIYRLGNMLFCFFFTKMYLDFNVDNKLHYPPIDCINEEYFEENIEKYKLNNGNLDLDTQLLIKLIKNMMKSNAKYRYNIDETKNDKWFGNLGPDYIVNPNFFTEEYGRNKIEEIINKSNQPPKYHIQKQGPKLSLINPENLGGSKRKNKRSKKYSLRRNKLRKTNKQTNQ
jgi:serine/threonine protein kinase